MTVLFVLPPLSLVYHSVAVDHASLPVPQSVGEMTSILVASRRDRNSSAVGLAKQKVTFVLVSVGEPDCTFARIVCFLRRRANGCVDDTCYALSWFKLTFDLKLPA